MIEIKNLSKSFETSEGPKQALKNISLEIPNGQCVLIGGENGSGKSVLMSLIAGLDKPDAGSVDTQGQRVGLVFQEAETQILGETVKEDVSFGPRNLKWDKKRIEEAVRNALEKTGLTDKAENSARFLSGGEKRRLAIACMIAMENPIIILDEPYANLDYGGVKQVNEIIRMLKQSGHTVIILTHELEKCLALSERFVVLYRGEKVFDGDPEDALKLDLNKWNIRNPLVAYKSAKDLVW